ncbi:Transferase [Penicillium italicum]|uniref:Transferase n=1 Tax=Penicillium italicum TaxID=40296 RepID=A0A0A2L244_PENIT|nr:Transferase [Penicillium italicum]
MVLDQVRVSTRHTLNCANEATVAALESSFGLGPMDHTVPAMLAIEAILVYRKPKTLPEDNFLPVERLKVAASHLLDYYPHLTGRLQQNPVSQAPEIGRLGTGAELWEAQCPRRLASIALSALSARVLVLNLPDSGNALLPIFHSTMGSVSHNSIFAIQHTRFGCGGVALGIRVHHQVCDATGFMQLVRDLAEIYKQLRDSSPPTLISPPEIYSHFRGTTSPSASQKKALAFNPPDFCLDQNSTVMPEASTPASVYIRPLRFHGQDLISLKNAATDPNTQEQTSFTRFELVSAYLYQRIYQARLQVMRDKGLTPDPDELQPLRDFWTTMDMRDSTRLKLPTRYFPNAIHCPSTSATHELLEKGELWQIAQVIHDAIHSVDMDEVKQQFEWIAAQPNKSHVRLKKMVPDGCLVATQWSRGKTYVGADFDVAPNGKRIAPSLVSPAFSEGYRVDGLAIILSTEEEVPRRQSNRGSLACANLPRAVDVNLSLDRSVWAVLNSDPDFLALLS